MKLTPKRPRWTKRRINELLLLRRLLSEATTINRGSHALERIKECERLAAKLSKSDLRAGRPSFCDFLVELAASDRRGPMGQ